MNTEISMNYSDSWLLGKAKQENNSILSAGGLVSALALQGPEPAVSRIGAQEELNANIPGLLVETRSGDSTLL